jgi:aminopeptidase-like protein
MQEYIFHWDTDVVGITLFVLISICLFVLIPFVTLLIFHKRHHLGNGRFLQQIAVVTTVVTVLPCCLVYLYSPQKIRVTNSSIEIIRIIKPVEIPIGNIITAKKYTSFGKTKSKRVFASGGLFGYYGRFSNNELGDFEMYATKLDELVLITTETKRYLISCESSEKFIADVQSKRRHH